MWEAIQYVTTGLTLVAFLVTVVAWAYKSKSEERERLIKTASEDKRADLVRSALEFFDVDTTGLTKEQKYELALAQIHARAQRFRTTAITVCVLAVILAVISAYAISQTPPPNGEKPKVQPQSKGEPKAPLRERIFDSRGPNKISLTSSTEWNYPSDVIRLRGTVVTNGKALAIRAEKLISEDARVVAFESPVVGASGRNGADGAAGGAGTGAGEAGARGTEGQSGGNGEPGVASGPVAIEATTFEGRLSVLASGGDGGDGGRGGNGGNGGNGARGEASRPGVIDCASGPGWGGRGGDGGAAGRGGDGGPGGSAATVSFRIKESFSGSIEALAKGAAGGRAGLAGSPGQRGVGGPEGEARGLCRPAGRNGANGADGASSAAGVQGQNGSAGRILVDLPHVTTEAIGEYKYESR